MTAIAPTQSALRVARRALVNAMPDARSKHLSEPLASACGYGSRAALLVEVKTQDADDPDIVLWDDRAVCGPAGWA